MGRRPVCALAYSGGARALPPPPARYHPQNSQKSRERSTPGMVVQEVHSSVPPPMITNLASQARSSSCTPPACSPSRPFLPPLPLASAGGGGRSTERRTAQRRKGIRLYLVVDRS